MASNIALAPLPITLRFQVAQRVRRKNLAFSIKAVVEENRPSLSCRAAQSEDVTEGQSTAEESTVRAQLNLLEQLTSSANINSGLEIDDDTTKPPTIREQLTELTRGRDGDFTLPLDKKMKEGLTVSQRRNIKRRTYLNEVARRNDVTFFAILGAFVVLPPVAILAVAIQTGYVQLFP